MSRSLAAAGFEPVRQWDPGEIHSTEPGGDMGEVALMIQLGVMQG
jgi:hypothetical protein